jgi:dihydroceramidase
VPTRVHNETGYWGPVDAIHQFCEPHYQTSPYLCEFYNTLSSFIFIGLAVYVWMYFPQMAQQDIYVRIALLWLALISVGSILFHGTMRYSFQLLDEFPMVGFMATLLCGKVSLWKHYAVLGQVFVVVSCVWLLYVYVVQAAYEIFLHGFTLLCVVDVIVGLLQPFHPRYKKIQMHALVVGLIAILSGRVAWETENRLCHVTPSVWPLHSVWHMLGCWSAWTQLVFTFLSRLPASETLHDEWLPGLWLSKADATQPLAKRD